MKHQARISLFSMLTILGSCTIQSMPQEVSTLIVEIGGEDWSFTRTAKHCESRVQYAVEAYEAKPAYSPAREPELERFLTNGSSDCWIELSITGVTGTSLLYKVSPDNEITEKRMFSDWLPYIRPYPESEEFLDRQIFEQQR